MVTGIIAIVICAVLAHYYGQKLGSNLQSKTQYLLLAICLSIAIVYVYFFRDSSWQISLLRLTNTFIYGKWLLIIGGFTTGVFMVIKTGNKYLRYVLCSIILVTCSFDWMIYFVVPRPDGGNVRHEWLSVQTSADTCSAAAASSLLRLHGIEVSEQDMIPACLTTAMGTPWQGVWRGLNLYASRTHRVILVKCASIHDIEFPILITAKLKRTSQKHRIYYEDWRWRPGIPHTVVLLSRNEDGTLTVGDPSIGIERWNNEALEVLWDGYGMILKSKQNHDREKR